jgi:Signal transduction histidine kinase, nitrate/nitrite-specific
MRISIAAKICFVLLLLFSAVLLGTTTYQTNQERQWALSLAEANAKAVALQFGATIDQQATSAQQQKITASIDGISLVYEPLAIHERVAYSVQRQLSHNQLLLTLPLYLINRGVTLTLPPAESQVAAIGLLHLKIDVADEMKQVEEDVFLTAIILCALFGSALLLALYIVRRQIVAPLQRLQQAMERATDLKEYSIRLPVERHDELSQLNDSFNQLMDEWQKSTREPPQ